MIKLIEKHPSKNMHIWLMFWKIVFNGRLSIVMWGLIYFLHLIISSMMAEQVVTLFAQSKWGIDSFFIIFIYFFYVNVSLPQSAAHSKGYGLSWPHCYNDIRLLLGSFQRICTLPNVISLRSCHKFTSRSMSGLFSFSAVPFSS